MLLLYHRWHINNGWAGIFTFHYASTLSSRASFIIFSIYYLHSTMLLLYLSDIPGKNGYLSIYIPLCFYFIESSGPCDIHRTYLHSTMLLLYRRTASCTVFRFLIYIPLCFYFIISQTRLITCISLFTFHYASTLSDSGKSLTTRIYHLHSTMLLLYREAQRLLIVLIFAFTFHYASTLSLTVPPLPLLFTIYIPLCFYFISARRNINRRPSRIYIPLCFYFIDPVRPAE